MQNLAPLFQAEFGRAPGALARAPGRIEFIGNHTDYNGGAVLGAAIDRFVTVAAAVAPAGRFRVRSTGGQPPVDLVTAPTARLEGPAAWANYPLGVWRALGDMHLARPAGFDLLVDSNLPLGAGLSSSAALELATGLALLRLAGGETSLEQLAALGRLAENRYVGVPCGILDQGTSAFGAVGQLVHIDCRGPVFSRVPLPAGTHLWIFNTHEKHALVDGLYATRHRECQQAAQALGVKLLADLTPAQLAEQRGGSSGGLALPEALARRAQHVVEEHARVGEMVAALTKGDLVAAGRLLTASHRSSQHLFENSTPALDRLVDLLAAHPAVLGARLTGGGFGGAVMALARMTFSEVDARKIADASGSHPDVIHLQSAAGAQVIG